MTTELKIDKEKFRALVYRELLEIRKGYDLFKHSSDGEKLFSSLRNSIGLMENQLTREKYLKALRQIEGISEYINDWINLSVDSNERFDFFILAKAQEVNSGDPQKDYFWALHMRHDQLLGLIKVLKQFIGHLKRFVSLPINRVLNDEVFVGLLERSLEDQVKLEYGT